jgi:hydroxymethylpyrimidine pyrophosphatase-like HAD family hydrolase
MARPFLELDTLTAHKIKLVMTDIDGTISPGDGTFPPRVRQAMSQLEKQGIAVGLASGRDLSEMMKFARELEISGPLVAENGAVVSLNKSDGSLDLHYDGKYTRGIMARIQTIFPDTVEASPDNRYRAADMMFLLNGLEPEALKIYLGEATLLDSGYTYHLAPKRAGKGTTIRRILPLLGGLGPENVIVFGDAENDLSMFQSFPVSILVNNPAVSAASKEKLSGVASYQTVSCNGDGFAETISQLLTCRLN